MLLSPCWCVPKNGREHEMDSVMEKIIINADDDDDNDDTSESTVSCDDNDDIEGVVSIVSDSEWSEVISDVSSKVKGLVKWSDLWSEVSSEVKGLVKWSALRWSSCG